MTPKQIALVRDSWKRLQPVAPQAAQMFYSRLFMLDPSLRHLFRSDLHAQGQKLVAMITLAVNSLDRLDAIVPGLEVLGRRHAGYGVQARHYAIVEPALVSALRQGLGAAFTDEVEDAWRIAYNLLATTMKRAARAMQAAA